MILKYHLAIIALASNDMLGDCTENVERNERIKLSPKMPVVEAAELPWSSVGKTPEARRAIFQT